MENAAKTVKKDAVLLLANGMIFEGKSLGAQGVIIGETVFTTGMNGYIETLTDPSYYGQIVTQTFPLIGNYGDIAKDYESAKCNLRGYIVREWCKEPSNFRCGGDLDSYLKAQNIIGLYDIDTRKLTKILRETGVMNGMLISGQSEEAKNAFAALEDENKKSELLAKIKEYSIVNAVASVTGSASGVEEPADVVFSESAKYRFVPVTADGTKINDPEKAMKNGKGKKVVLWDFGAKGNILHHQIKHAETSEKPTTDH